MSESALMRRGNVLVLAGNHEDTRRKTFIAGKLTANEGAGTPQTLDRQHTQNSQVPSVSVNDRTFDKMDERLNLNGGVDETMLP